MPVIILFRIYPSSVVAATHPPSTEVDNVRVSKSPAYAMDIDKLVKAHRQRCGTAQQFNSAWLAQGWRAMHAATCRSW